MMHVLVALSVLTGTFLFGLAPARAHDWYPMECCHGQDCAPVDAVAWTVSTRVMTSSFWKRSTSCIELPIADHAFFEQAVPISTSARVSLSWWASSLSVFTSSEVASRAVSPARRFLPASRNSFDQR